MRKSRRVIRAFLSVYLWGFILYQSTPVIVIPSTNYAPKELSPVPVLYTYTYAYGVKTAFKHHAGSIENLLEALRKKAVDFAFGDFPEAIAYRLYPVPKDIGCAVVRVSDTGIFVRLSHLVFEVIPSLLIFKEPEKVLTRLDPPLEDCTVIAHDGRVLISTFFGLDIPPYSLILDAGRNVFFSREVLIRSPDPEEILRSSIALFGDVNLIAFAYSERSFYLPGESTHYDFRYVLETDVPNPIIYLYRDGELFGIYTQNRINIPLFEEGSYSSVLKSYRFRIGAFYFGVRTLAVVPPIRLL